MKTPLSVDWSGSEDHADGWRRGSADQQTGGPPITA